MAILQRWAKWQLSESDSESFKSKRKITGNTPADGNTIDVETIFPLKYLSNFLAN